MCDADKRHKCWKMVVEILWFVDDLQLQKLGSLDSLAIFTLPAPSLFLFSLKVQRWNRMSKLICCWSALSWKQRWLQSQIGVCLKWSWPWSHTLLLKAVTHLMLRRELAICEHTLIQRWDTYYSVRIIKGEQRWDIKDGFFMPIWCDYGVWKQLIQI